MDTTKEQSSVVKNSKRIVSRILEDYPFAKTLKVVFNTFGFILYLKILISDETQTVEGGTDLSESKAEALKQDIEKAIRFNFYEMGSSGVLNFSLAGDKVTGTVSIFDRDKVNSSLDVKQEYPTELLTLWERIDAVYPGAWQFKYHVKEGRLTGVVADCLQNRCWTWSKRKWWFTGGSTIFAKQTDLYNRFLYQDKLNNFLSNVAFPIFSSNGTGVIQLLGKVSKSTWEHQFFQDENNVAPQICSFAVKRELIPEVKATSEAKLVWV